ncbi:Mur ligase family protein [Candidatus Microgenomates bacterium]|nr:Mur ligase family protein [Candidatus Microgenomates bacterium]
MFLIILIGKVIIFASRLLNIGNGGTWPGEIALHFYPKIFLYFAGQIKKSIILVAGTNGKTTTSKLIKHILIESGTDPKKIIHNESGANLVNGLISSFIQNSTLTGKISSDYAIFEVDEASLSQVLEQLTNFRKKLVVVLLNLFRDQLDRYGEVDTIAGKWSRYLQKLQGDFSVVLNGDDPQIAYLGNSVSGKKYFFGINRPGKFLKTGEHATDSTYCLNCGHKLQYKGIYFSHIGIWFCPNCAAERPTPQISGWPSPLVGLYNEYNTLAAVGVAKILSIPDKEIRRSLNNFKPAFGRQEEFIVDGKKIKIFLAKNPAGFNASLRTVLERQPKTILLVLNDRIPDGRDVSWIWDVDFEMIPKSVKVIVSGERVYDMALRIKYTMKPACAGRQCNNPPAGGQMKQLMIYENLHEAIYSGLDSLDKDEIHYILPTYTAMLEVRKILGGRKIL